MLQHSGRFIGTQHVKDGLPAFSSFGIQSTVSGKEKDSGRKKVPLGVGTLWICGPYEGDQNPDLFMSLKKKKNWGFEMAVVSGFPVSSIRNYRIEKVCAYRNGLAAIFLRRNFDCISNSEINK